MAEFDDLKFTFLYIDLYSMGAGWYYPESSIPYNMLRYIVKGEAEFSVNGEKFTVRENDIIYIPNGCRLWCSALTKTFEFYSIRFISTVSYTKDDVLEKYYGIPRITKGNEEEKYFQEIYKWARTDHIAKKCFIRGYLNILLGSLSFRGESRPINQHKTEQEINDLEKIVLREQNSRRTDTRVQVVADYVAHHPAEKFNPEKMADMVGLSKQRFGSLFKRHMGKTPMEYVREVKLSTAARKLIVSTESINDISYEIGYEDPNYFIREFKSAFGYTPNQYRLAAKES